MGLLDSFIKGMRDFTLEMQEHSLTTELTKLAQQGDPSTVVFTNVRRLDNVIISRYAVDAAIDDGSPVYLLSDQGKILLMKATAGHHIEKSLVPPQEGDYIFICDFNAQREDIQTEHYNYIREPHTISDDWVAYFFDADNQILCCSTAPTAVEDFKKVVEMRRQLNELPPIDMGAQSVAAAPSPQTSMIEIRRKRRLNPLWWNLILIDYRVFVDGNKIGQVGNGDSQTFALSPGAHTLQLVGLWKILVRSKALDFNINKNQRLNFDADYNLLGLLCGWMPFVNGIDIEKR